MIYRRENRVLGLSILRQGPKSVIRDLVGRFIMAESPSLSKIPELDPNETGRETRLKIVLEGPFRPYQVPRLFSPTTSRTVISRLYISGAEYRSPRSILVLMVIPKGAARSRLFPDAPLGPHLVFSSFIITPLFQYAGCSNSVAPSCLRNRAEHTQRSRHQDSWGRNDRA